MSLLTQNLEFLLRTHEIKPAALAAAVGLQQPTLHRILSGNSADPRSASLQPIADYFKVTVEQLRNLDLEKWGIPEGKTPSTTDENQVDDLLKVQLVRPRAPLVAPFRMELLAQLAEHLGVPFDANINRRLEILGTQYRFDYCSDRVAGDFGKIVVRQPVRGTPAPYQLFGITASLWKLSVLRQSSKGEAPNRHYCLFLSLTPHPEAPTPHRLIARITSEAALHGIHVIVGDAPEAAEAIKQMERNDSTFYDPAPAEDEPWA
ncbi:helix-turn-helix domain-containing protein [Burkholderia aenigmatica]|uniref:helix-turn-helix domain-containing protein n=1 Tax=Burkholderia aenigmatica TaxID=2015348 RepID=UPI00264E2665|nr:helix-turn-helix transcriptional regulator [Burkholderia aenigmatica]MDN7881413.1 helix-turn-helix transcriptional regulator [Burkholderia aenigmatica]